MDRAREEASRHVTLACYLFSLALIAAIPHLSYDIEDASMEPSRTCRVVELGPDQRARHGRADAVDDCDSAGAGEPERGVE